MKLLYHACEASLQPILRLREEQDGAPVVGLFHALSRTYSSIVRSESNCQRRKRPRPTTSGKMVLAVNPL
jgi:hypothetical protein